MAIIKAHVTLSDHAAGDASARRETLAQILRAAKISGVNESRFEKYGILTGMVDDSELEAIRGVAGVTSVEVDSVKKIGK